MLLPAFKWLNGFNLQCFFKQTDLFLKWFQERNYGSSEHLDCWLHYSQKRLYQIYPKAHPGASEVFAQISLSVRLTLTTVILNCYPPHPNQAVPAHFTFFCCFPISTYHLLNTYKLTIHTYLITHLLIIIYLPFT